MHALVRFVFITIIRFFYRQISVRGRQDIPASGPVLVVANHPNGLLDPLVIRAALRREVGFMAKATLFENPAGKLAMDSFAALPVFRAKDGKDTSANEKTFAAVDERFGQGRWVVIFPEGHSHSEPNLQRMKTGAARMTLSSEAKRDFELGLQIVPVGLIYEDKEIFRSRVSVVFGPPIQVSDYAASYRKDEWATAQQLTNDVGQAIARLMLEADDSEVWQGFLAVARWTDPDAVADVGAAETRAKQLAAAYRELVKRDPVAAEEFANDARRFVAMLEAVGVEDPFHLERPTPPPLYKVIWDATKYAMLAPFAIGGWLLNAPPYYAIAPLAVRVAGDDTDIISTVKAIAGLVFYPLTWVIEALIVWALFDIWSALAVACAGPLLGLVAVRYFERLDRRRDAVVGTWLRFSRRSVVDAVVARREELAQRVNEALSLPAPTGKSGTSEFPV